MAKRKTRQKARTIQASEKLRANYTILTVDLPEDCYERFIRYTVATGDTVDRFFTDAIGHHCGNIRDELKGLGIPIKEYPGRNAGGTIRDAPNHKGKRCRARAWLKKELYKEFSDVRYTVRQSQCNFVQDALSAYEHHLDITFAFKGTNVDVLFDRNVDRWTKRYNNMVQKFKDRLEKAETSEVKTSDQETGEN